MPIEIAKSLTFLDLCSKGAEANIMEGEFLGKIVVIKVRNPKKYRHPILDRSLRLSRTKREGKVMQVAKTAKLNVPYLFGADIGNYTLIIEKLHGCSLAECILCSNLRIDEYLKLLGKQVCLFHLTGLVHGDLTPFNVIIKEDQPYLIDFGLASFADDIEVRAQDLVTFKDALRGFYPKNDNDCWQFFWNGYGQYDSSLALKIDRQMKKICTRGRYVSKDKRKKHI